MSKIFLNKGLKFACATVTAPIDNIVVSIESAVEYRNIADKINIYTNVSNMLSRLDINKTKHKRNNQDNNQQKIVSSLREKDVIYVKSDKGNSVVIMDKDEYDQKF